MEDQVMLSKEEAIFISKMLFLLLSLHAIKPFLLPDEIKGMELLGLKFIQSFKDNGGGNILN